MGIINVTPDSFSDGGQLVDVQLAVAAAQRMVADGADIIDIGGESTRPGAVAVSPQQELDRVMPVLEALQPLVQVPISVDTSSPEVMTQALRAGASMINDVRSLTRPGALEAVADSSAAICLMHMRGTPETMQQRPDYDDVVAEVVDFLGGAVERCVAAGISRQRLIVDPGFGFGKTLQHNLTLLARLPELKSLHCPLLAGLSRKSMFEQLLGRAVDQRLAATLSANQVALDGGADILRVHDVGPHNDMRTIWREMASKRHGFEPRQPGENNQ